MDSDTRAQLAAIRRTLDPPHNPLADLPPGGTLLPPTGQLRDLTRQDPT